MIANGVHTFILHITNFSTKYLPRWAQRLGPIVRGWWGRIGEEGEEGGKGGAKRKKEEA